MSATNENRCKHGMPVGTGEACPYCPEPSSLSAMAGCGSSIFQQTMNKKFVIESNLIEGITRPPKSDELVEHERFMFLERVTIEELARFVRVYQPDARLRDKPGLDVRVGNHIPPRGGNQVRNQLETLLGNLRELGAYRAHLEYETLHPFTDGNGRSGRMLWAWQMQDYPLGFLHHFYYQTLGATNRESHNGGAQRKPDDHQKP